MQPNRKSLIAGILALAALGGQAAAQTAPPTLQTISPTGAQRGTRATLTIRGTNIGEPKRLLFSEPGFAARITNVKEIPIEKRMTPKGVVRTDAPIEDKARRFELTAVVTIGGGVPHGVHGVRIETALGVSNLLRFAVSALPEIVEREPNDPDAPVKVTLPGALVGALGQPGDIDAYEFRARDGEDLVFQVVARPVASRIDSIVRLLDATGKVVAENNDFDLSRDSVLTWRCSESGRYRITIQDLEHAGGREGFTYRIYAGALPYVTDIFPLGVKDTAQPAVTARGPNLGSAAKAYVAGGTPAPGRSVPLAVSSASGLALNLKSIVLGRYPEARESEPNDDLALAQRIAIPSTVNGYVRLEDATQEQKQTTPDGDHDLYRFSARKGQKVVIDVTAQQLGSPLDSIVEILDRNGRVVPRAIVRCVAQTEITLNDPDSTRRGMRLAAWNELAINDVVLIGDELLEIASMPTHPDDDIIFKSYRGIRVPLLDTTARTHSVGEAVYKAQIHSPGTRLEPNGMPVFQIDYVNDDGGARFGGKDSRLHFEAPADGDYVIRLKDVRGLEGERFAYRLTVREPAPDFDVTFDPKSFNIPRGGRVSVTVTADRSDGFEGPIDVELVDLPPGLSATTGRIPSGADTTVLMVGAAADASLARQTAAVPSMYRHIGESARSTRAASPTETFGISGLAALKLVGRATIDGKAIIREAVVAEPLPVIALAPPPDLVVTTGAQRIEVIAGQQVELTVNVERRNGFAARVPISVMNLPHGVRVDDIGLNGVMITEQENSRVIRIVAEPWVRAQTQPLLIVGRVEVNSPLRNEAAALPVELVIRPAPTVLSRAR
jgi:hypothetical protein